MSLESSPLRGLFCFLDLRSSPELDGDILLVPDLMEVNCCRRRSVVLDGLVATFEGHALSDGGFIVAGDGVASRGDELADS